MELMVTETIENKVNQLNCNIVLEMNTKSKSNRS